MAEPARAAPTPTFGRTAAAFVRRDLLVAASYKLSFVVRLGALFVVLASLAWLARFVAPGDAAVAGGFVGFWVVGVTVADLFGVMATSLSVRVREAQLMGTLEAVLATPAPTAHVVLSTGLSDVLLGVLRLALSLAFAALFLDVELGAAHLGSAALVAALALAAFTAFGLLGGALTMLLRRTDPLSAVAGLATMVIGGVFYPISALPDALRPLAWLFPVGPALEALRLALFTGAGPGAIAAELGALAAFTAVAAGVGALLFRHALARARADGALGQY